MNNLFKLSSIFCLAGMMYYPAAFGCAPVQNVFQNTSMMHNIGAHDIQSIAASGLWESTTKTYAYNITMKDFYKLSPDWTHIQLLYNDTELGGIFWMRFRVGSISGQTLCCLSERDYTDKIAMVNKRIATVQTHEANNTNIVDVRHCTFRCKTGTRGILDEVDVEINGGECIDKDCNSIRFVLLDNSGEKASSNRHYCYWDKQSSSQPKGQLWLSQQSFDQLQRLVEGEIKVE